MQGIDYAYTLQGWLKGINSTGGAIAADAGSDGVSGGLNQFTARDALGLTLNYFEGDYRNLRAPTINPFPDYTNGMDIESPYRPLFNGNISSMSVYNRKFEAGVAGGPLVFNNYKYDQLNRLTRMDVYATGDFYTNGWANMSIPGTRPMEERVRYDANGNILGYIRNGITATPIGMDTLEYRYYPGTNQLMQIGDKVPADRYGSNSWEVILDIDSQAHVKNYIYDEIGNLITDSAERINSIKWSVYGKILEIRRDATDKVPITFIRYTYDALGNRISKVFNLGGDTLYTWYVRDAQGNMLSIYTDKINVPHTLSNLNVTQAERYIYGSSRVGVYNLGASVDGDPGSTEFYNTNTFFRGWKQYELSNHLGNVLVTLSDKKFGVSSMGSLTHYEPDMTSGNDYYPFGMLSRIATSSVANYYRHGFNGKEFDWEAKGWQNQYDYGFRIYDPRIGKFLSVDPLTKDYPWYTPYQFAGNSPIQYIDLDGQEPAVPPGAKGVTYNPEDYRNRVEQKSITANAAFARGVVIGPAVGSLILADYLYTGGQVTKAVGIGMTAYSMSQVYEYTNRNSNQKDPEIRAENDRMARGAAVDVVVGLVINKTISVLTKITTEAGKVVYKYFSSSSIRFSQSSVNGLDDIVTSMKQSGWKGDPIDIVRMEDKIYTTVDNTRLLAAQKAGIDVKAVAHNYDELIPENMAKRFVGKDGTLPTTWGEAVKNRIQNQNKTFRTTYENGTFVQPKEGTRATGTNN